MDSSITYPIHSSPHKCNHDSHGRLKAQSKCISRNSGFYLFKWWKLEKDVKLQMKMSRTLPSPYTSENKFDVTQ